MFWLPIEVLLFGVKMCCRAAFDLALGIQKFLCKGFWCTVQYWSEED